MTIDADTLRRLSPLLDQALDLGASDREAWLDGLEGDAAELAPILRAIFSRQALKVTNDLLDRPLEFTAVGNPDSADAAIYSAGDTVGPYVLLSEIGRGGMGEVWLAERSDGQLRRTVALKLPMLGLRRSVLVQRFARERDILGSLAHPHIARLYDAGFGEDSQPYLALEYVEGVPITQYCAEQHLDARARVTLLQQVMGAVQYAHANLVIHRDLKPSNVLVTAKGQAMLLDFGIAKLLQEDEKHAQETELTRLGGHALTLHYAAPEQVSGAPVSIATDVYALGVLLYELLSGERPFRGERRDVETAVLTQEAIRPQGVPDDLATIVLKALKKVPAERYATVNAFSDDLSRWLRDEPVLAQPDSTGYRLRKFVSRNKAAVASGAVMALVIVTASGVSIWQAHVAREQTRIAQTEAKTAEAVQDFLEGVFRANSGDQSDPIKARQRTAKQLLDGGAARIAKELDDEPQAKLRVLKTLANMYEDMSETEASTAMLRQRHQLAEKRIGPNSAAAAEALADLGRELAEAENLKESQATLEKADAILQRWPDPSGRAEVRRDIGLATLYSRTDPNKGVASAERALTALRLQPPSLDLVEALLLRGLNLHQAGNLVPARQALEEGLQTAPSAPGGARSLSIELLITLARVTGQMGDIDLADQYFARALQLSESDTGAAGLHTLVTIGQRGENLANGGRLREGAELLGKTLSLLLAWPDSPDRTAQIPGFAAYDARMLLRVGRPEEALAVADLGLSHWNSAMANPRWAANLLATRGLSLLQLGRHVEAEVAFAAARELIEKAHLDAAWSRLVVLGEARLLALRGRGASALEVWRQYRRVASLPDLPPVQDFAALSELAEFELAADLPGAAFDHADQGFNALIANARRAHHAEVESQLQLLRGLALAKLQRPAEARAALAEAVRLREATLDVEQSPQLAEARLALVAALLANHETDAARGQWMQARDIVARHARLGEQYLQPLRTLKQSLKLS